ncbi:MAG: TonB family protein [Patiriisocius sp.]|jgi:TonB family protein
MEPGDKLPKKPVYPGGRKALALFIKENLAYPSEALKNKVEGLVIVRIDIDGKGSVARTRLKKKLGHGCDEEAIRIVRMLKFFVTKRRKTRVTYHKKIKIHFTLPKPKKKDAKPLEKSNENISQGFEVVYTYVPKKI